MMIRCPGCSAKNRIPDDRGSRDIRCGRCKRIFTNPEIARGAVKDRSLLDDLSDLLKRMK